MKHQVAPIHKFHHEKQTILDTNTREDPTWYSNQGPTSAALPWVVAWRAEGVKQGYSERHPDEGLSKAGWVSGIRPLGGGGE